MRPAILNRLSTKLTKKSILLISIIGFIGAFLQVCLDFNAQRKAINLNIIQLIKSNSNIVQHAIASSDIALANSIVHGLNTFPFISSITLYDKQKNVITNAGNSISDSHSNFLTEFLIGKETRLKEFLYSSQGKLNGILDITIDNNKALEPLYTQLFNILFFGLLVSIILGLTLTLLYHYTLTQPLAHLAKRLASLNQEQSLSSRVEHLADHAYDELGLIINTINNLLSNTEKRQLDLQQRESQMRIILDASPNQIFALDSNGKFIFLNNATASFYGFIKIEDLVGKSYKEIHKADKNETINVLESIESLTISNDTKEENEDQDSLNIVQNISNTSGQTYTMQMCLKPFKFYDEKCALVLASDITARVEAEERVERLAYYDTLTSLPNRNQIHKKLFEDVSYSEKVKTNGAVLFIDIDDFKRINDTMGHAVGDELLLHISNKMRTQIRKTETLARLGGDEFILSIPNISNNSYIAENQARELAERLLAAIRKPCILEGQKISVNASIGIAIYPYSSNVIDELLRYADTAMYEAKHLGKNCCAVFKPFMAETANKALRLEGDIRNALQESQFCFHLQPLVDSRTLDIIGAEALIRWNHPERGQILPDEFIHYLETSSMMTDVGNLIIDDVCRFIARNRAAHKLNSDIRISINISTRELFQENFVENISKVLQRYHLPGNCLDLEITESVALEGLDQVIEKMHKLQAIGVSFSLDDFGTGYSSLNYLKKLPVDRIKIDKSFIKNITIDKQDAALVSSIVTIAKNLELKVVIEGVETEEQAQWLMQYGDVIFQGFLFNEPLSAVEFSSIYMQENPTPMLPLNE